MTVIFGPPDEARAAEDPPRVVLDSDNRTIELTGYWGLDDAALAVLA